MCARLDPTLSCGVHVCTGCGERRQARIRRRKAKGKTPTDADLEEKVKQALELHMAKSLSLRESARRVGLSSHKQLERTKKAMLDEGSWDSWAQTAHGLLASATATDGVAPACAAPEHGAPEHAAPADAVNSPAAAETPLRERLRKRATRPGDAVAYGQHGPTGMYREGIKWGTIEISQKGQGAARWCGCA